MTRSPARAAAAATAVAVLGLTAGCGSSSGAKGSESAGCGLSSTASLEKALGSDQLSSTGQGSIKQPDPVTGMITCDTARTERTGYSVHVQVHKASAADLKSRADWSGKNPNASPGCHRPAFVKDDTLVGVSCVEAASKGEETRVYVVSKTHTIVTEISLAAQATPADTKAAFAIAQSTQQIVE